MTTATSGAVVVGVVGVVGVVSVLIMESSDVGSNFRISKLISLFKLSDLRSQISNFRSQISDLKSQISDLKSRNPGLITLAAIPCSDSSHL